MERGLKIRVSACPFHQNIPGQAYRTVHGCPDKYEVFLNVKMYELRWQKERNLVCGYEKE